MGGRWLGGLFMAVMLANAPGTAEATGQKPRSLLSKSRQFIITTNVRQPRTLPPTNQKPIPDRIQLTPDKLAHFAESVRDQLLQRLQLPQHQKWTGAVQLNILPGTPQHAVAFTRQSLGGRWRYRLDLPEVMTPAALTRAIVAVQLEEYAARGASAAVLPPPWLAEGTTELLMQSTGPVLFAAFQHGAGGVLNFQFPNDPMARSRAVILSGQSISFLNLTLPPAEWKTPVGRAQLRAHAHLLVTKLLQQPRAGHRLAKFLRALPRHANPQHAFLAAYGHVTMLHAEQWWTLAQTQFRSRDATNRWVPGVALDHLANALRVPAAKTDPEAEKAPPLVKLQQRLATGAHASHSDMIKNLQRRLLLIQFNAPPKLARLVRDYRTTLDQYTNKAIRKNFLVRETDAALAEITIRRLNQLDAVLADLQAVHTADQAKLKLGIAPAPPGN